MSDFPQQLFVHARFSLVHHAAKHVLLQNVRFQTSLRLLELALQKLSQSLVVFPSLALPFLLLFLHLTFFLAHILDVVLPILQIFQVLSLLFGYLAVKHRLYFEVLPSLISSLSKVKLTRVLVPLKALFDVVSLCFLLQLFILVASDQILHL